MLTENLFTQKQTGAQHGAEKLPENKSRKRRFKLDKKHIQGFIAGILLCAIAFTGLYYGTDRRFFAGSVTGMIPVVTDANFESEVLKARGHIFVLSDINGDSTTLTKHMNNIRRVGFYCEIPQYEGLVKIVELDPDKSTGTIKTHDFKNGAYITVYEDGKRVFVDTSDMAFFLWLDKNVVPNFWPGHPPMVTEANFEDKVLKANGYIFVASKIGNVDSTAQNKHEINARQLYEATNGFWILTPFELESKKLTDTLKKYGFKEGAYVTVFKDGKRVTEAGTFSELGYFIWDNCPRR